MAGNQRQKDQVLTGVGLTAVCVAAARAAESQRSDPLFDDPFAADFVTAAEAELSFTNYHLPSAQDTADLWSWVANYIAIRTRFFDDYLRDVCAEGCRQVVILAAGLDTQAFRLSWPAGVRLFELDTADVLTFKDRAPRAQEGEADVDRVLLMRVTVQEMEVGPPEPLCGGVASNRVCHGRREEFG